MPSIWGTPPQYLAVLGSVCTIRILGCGPALEKVLQVLIFSLNVWGVGFGIQVWFQVLNSDVGI